MHNVSGSESAGDMCSHSIVVKGSNKKRKATQKLEYIG